MATIYYDFSASTNGAGTPTDPKNAWATPGNGDVIRIKRGNRWVRVTQLNFSSFTDLTVEAWANADGSDDPTLPKPIIAHTAASTFAWNFAGDGVHRIRNMRFQDCSTNTNGGVIGAGTVAATGVGAQLDVQDCDFDGCNFNAIRLSATGAAASPTFKALHNTFRNVGEDCVYGGALVYEFGYNDCRNLSTNTTTGDAVGYFAAVPVRAWIHHNYIDHGADSKQCIIIDSNTTDAGLAIIERNTLIGYGTENTPATNHTVVNGDARMIIRYNNIYTAGIAINIAGNASAVYGNHIFVRNRQVTSPNVVAVVCSGSAITNNTIIGVAPLDTCWGITQSSGESGNSIQNNLIVNLPGGIKTDGGTDPTVSNNALWQVGTPYSGGSLGAVSDVTTNPNITGDGSLLLDSPLIGAGVHINYRFDITGNAYLNPPSIGAYEYPFTRNSREIY